MENALDVVTKSQLEIITNNPGKEKFKCNICFQMFGINDM